MPSVFISYSSHDAAAAQRLKDALQQRDIRAWIDQTDLLRGDAIEARIRDAIEEHDFLLVVLSAHSMKSAWIHFEVGLASHRSRAYDAETRVLPVQIEDCELPLYLQGTRLVNLRSAQTYEEEIDGLVNSIRVAHRRRRNRRFWRMTRGALLLAALVAPTVAAFIMLQESRQQRDSDFNALAHRVHDQLRTHPAESRENAEQLLLRFPESPEAYRLRGWVYYRDEEFPAAYEKFEKGHQLWSTGKRTGVTATTEKALRLGKANSAMALGTEARLQEAHKIFSEIIQQYTREETAHANLATVVFKQRKFDDAAKAFADAHHALKSTYKPGQPNAVLGYVMVGWALSLHNAKEPVERKLVLQKLKTATCYHASVEGVLLRGARHVEFYDFNQFIPYLAEMKADEAYAESLRSPPERVNAGRCDSA